VLNHGDLLPVAQCGHERYSCGSGDVKRIHRILANPGVSDAGS
jgi:hypothetical protein